MAYATYIGGPLADRVTFCGYGRPPRILTTAGGVLTGYATRRARSADTPRYVLDEAPSPELLADLTKRYPIVLSRRSRAPIRVYRYVPGRQPCGACGR